MKFTYVKQDEFGRPRDCGEYRSDDGQYWIIRYVPFEDWTKYKSNADPRFAAFFGAERLGDFGTFCEAIDACERHAAQPSGGA